MKRMTGFLLDKNIRCDYGCGGIAYYRFDNGKVCCGSNIGKCPTISKRRVISRIANRKKEKRVGLVLDSNIICDYGCGQQAHYQFNNGKVSCERNWRTCPVGGKKCLSEERSKKISNTLIKKYADGSRKRWNEGLTKETDSRVASQAGKMKGRPGVNLGKRGPETSMWGKKRPEHSKFMKENNPLHDPEKGAERRRKVRVKATERAIRQGKIPSYNETACKFFKQFDKDHNTQGQYATNGGEFHIKALGYWLDYINLDLKLIIEWDEESHYNTEGNLRKRDVERQQEIQEHFPDFKFMRIRQSEMSESKQREWAENIDRKIEENNEKFDQQVFR